MIVTSCKPYGIIKGMLKKWKKTGVIACNSCARACETGGRARMEELSERLMSDGFNIVEKVKTVRTNRITQIIESMSPEHRHGLLQGLETFIHAALTDDNMMEAICQHCGSEAFDSCILNRTHAERTQAQEEQVCN